MKIIIIVFALVIFMGFMIYVILDASNKCTEAGGVYLSRENICVKKDILIQEHP